MKTAFHRLLRRLCPLLAVFCVTAEGYAAPAVGGDHVVPKAAVPVVLRGISPAMTTSTDEVVILQIDLTGDTQASPPLADDLAFFVRRHYLEQGYLRVEVEWKLEGKSIVLVIHEGIQQHVDKTAFVNNPKLAEDELRRYLLRPTRERVGKFAATTPYVAKEINDGSMLVLRYLLSQGYVDASIDPPVPANHEDGTTDLTVTLHPHEQWHVGVVQVDGAPPMLAETLRTEAIGLQGQPLNEARVENTRRQIEGEIQSRGYFVGKVSATSRRGSGTLMNVQFTAVPGSLYRVSDVQLDPKFSHGASRLVQTSFRSAVGHVFDSQRMETNYNRVIDTGIFEHLEMEPKVEGDGRLALAFTGEEAKRASVALSGGYDTFLGAILGIEYRNVNWMDSGNTLTANILGTQLGLQAGIQWKNPAIFDSPYSLSLGVKPETFTFDGYTRDTLAARAAVSRDISKRLSLELYVDGSTNKVTSDTLTPAQLGPEKYDLGLAGLSLVYEARDNPVSPRKGFFAKGTVESGYITGSDKNLSYTHTDFAVSYYQPISQKWRAAAGAHFASVISDADVDMIPIELRVYNGGAKGVRSFGERELGPKAKDGTPLGGTQSEVISGEISYEIAKNLELAGFVDAGSLRDASKGGITPSFEDLHYAAGLGLRYRLPFGPLRVDYGVNMNRHENEPSGALHIGFGFAF
ncbi:MAG: outer membrane protein assembly factor [Verrucomicrobiaceae bacterium]|nr:outer membrane protein assembly factor [Verrucomicrobiaceae bacterium]